MHAPLKLFGARLIAVFAALAAFAPVAAAVTLSEGLSAYRANRVAQAEDLLAQVAADPAAPASDRAAALRELGRIEGLVRGETGAIARAMAQTVEGEERCATAALALHIYRDAGQADAALPYAEAAVATCPPGPARQLRVELARAHLDLAANAASRAQHLSQASAQLAALDDNTRGAPAVASTRLSVAIAQRNAGAALQAWRDYYWLTSADAPQALSAFAGRVGELFADGLAADAADADMLALIELLIRAGFTADARRFASETRIADRANGNPQWRKAEAYLAFDQAVRDATLRANREMASGGAAAWYRDEVMGAASRLMQAANLSGDPLVALAEAFGAYGTLGETSGYPSLHAGHLVQDERIAVEQYGRRTEMRFMSGQRFSAAELEYRAKLSEIALADYPRLALANIAGQSQGDTPHGRANRRVLQGYRDWVRSHRREIAGFDRTQPGLSQLHLLTDDQIRAVARRLDPWARS